MLNILPSKTLSLKQHSKFRLGQLGSITFPKRASDIMQSFSVPQFHYSSYIQNKIDNWIHFYLVQSKIQKEATQVGELENAHREYWSKSEGYFEQFSHLTEESYIPIYQDVVGDLIPLLKAMNIKYANEFGTGDGQWLNYLTQQWPFIAQFTGIDISAIQIEKNQDIFPHITFEASDLVAWADKNANPRSLYHTNGGVLEYLSERSVRKLLTILKERAPHSLIFFNEPIYADYDYAVDTASRVVGSEFTYNHNYIYLFEELEIELVRCEERDAFGYRVVLAIGKT